MRIIRRTTPLYLLISVLLIMGIAEAEIPDWHKPTPCFGCHSETLGADYGAGECGNCHYYRLATGGLNIPLLQSDHNPKICRGCHIGNTLDNGTDRDLFHNGHNNVKCNQCHEAENSTIVRIEGIEEKGFPCVSCHGNQIHSIHINKLDKVCPICHGSWAKGKAYIGNTSSSSSNTTQRDSNLERFTIFNFIKNLINAILGIT